MLEMFEPFIGCWDATDGSSRQELSWGLDHRVIHTRMWFRDGDEWKLVSEGAMYADPGRDEVVGFAATIDMPVSHFTMTAKPTPEGPDFDNVIYDPDGTPMQAIEQWRSLGNDGFTWHLFQPGDDGLTPWMDGEWSRNQE